MWKSSSMLEMEQQARKMKTRALRRELNAARGLYQANRYGEPPDPETAARITVLSRELAGRPTRVSRLTRKVKLVLAGIVLMVLAATAFVSYGFASGRLAIDAWS